MIVFCQQTYCRAVKKVLKSDFQIQFKKSPDPLKNEYQLKESFFVN